jgi:DNA-binding CsgD family transcriptional regulator
MTDLHRLLDALDDGIMAFDADLCLTVWNQPVQSIMGFPPHLMQIGTPFLSFVEFNISRGEHGRGERRLIVRQRLASLTDSYSRRRPDGSLIQVRGKTLPDGGVLKQFRLMESPGGLSNGPPPALSAREREVLLWAAQGKTAWETSTILGLSPKTVEFHLANCGRKLGTSSKAQTILAAARAGLLPL